MRICAVTGTRAEFGILQNLLEQMRSHETIDLKLVVTGTHLSPSHGMTVREIEAAGFTVDARCEIVLSSDTSHGVCSSAALALMELSGAFERLKPDLLLLLGDRYEALAAAMAATIHRIPIAHLHGGEATYGLIDECFRHSITKMSHLHFTATEAYRERVIRLGEDPGRVYNVGALGVENSRRFLLITRETLEQELKLKLDQDTVLMTYHPETLREDGGESGLQAIRSFIGSHPELRFILTKANADPSGARVNQMLEEIAAAHPERCRLVASLGRDRFFSVLTHAGLMLGNSSSGIIEAPSFGIPTLNIGHRQAGRVAADSVFSCGETQEAIETAYALARDYRRRGCTPVNPYEGSDTSRTIIQVMLDSFHAGIRLEKAFYDGEAGTCGS